MMMKKKKMIIGDIVGCITVVILFIIPFWFILVNALKDKRSANLLSISMPESLNWSNFIEVITRNDYQILTAFKNSLLIAAASVAILILTASMAAYTLQRRGNKITKTLGTIFMLGLMMPSAILPTIWVLKQLNIYKTLFSLVMIEVALSLPSNIMLYRGFMSTIPVELEEAAIIDGCTSRQLFFKVVFPLLKPITSTIIILSSVTIFNDFTNPLYFLPGKENVTVQLTLYNYISKFANEYNLLFADVLLITIPMLILFLIFNKKIIAGMVAGSVKG